ncbi:MAG: RdgB/HAM1 family non-canonical purine NTP pyrophosphatase [Methyloceanibacter sp.]|nr:RdgB/HAM1 family non-canonical purine NTP pyrophosphatase [Methyloceanibacter sp.]
MTLTLKAGTRLVIASHNKGKVREMGELLAPFGIETISVAELGLPEPDETGTSFIENAKLKAVAAANASGMLALSDDSGLEIKAIGGAPGIHSALWGGPDKDFNLAMAKVEDAIRKRGATDITANFTCALALAKPGGKCQAFEGKVFGKIVFPPRGTRGFGYDPIFIADGETLTFGEMDPDAKHAISHRARAFEKLISATFDDD